MAPCKHRLRDYADIIRSKNAGPYRLTFDILFRGEESFRAVLDSDAVTRDSVARAYGVNSAQVSSLFVVPEGRAIKVTLIRPIGQGERGNSDIYGCQQHLPLMDLPVPSGKDRPGGSVGDGSWRCCCSRSPFSSPSSSFHS